MFRVLAFTFLFFLSAPITAKSAPLNLVETTDFAWYQTTPNTGPLDLGINRISGTMIGFFHLGVRGDPVDKIISQLPGGLQVNSIALTYTRGLLLTSTHAHQISIEGLPSSGPAQVFQHPHGPGMTGNLLSAPIHRVENLVVTLGQIQTDPRVTIPSGLQFDVAYMLEIDVGELTVVPLPAALPLLLSGIAFLAAGSRRRRQSVSSNG